MLRPPLKLIIFPCQDVTHLPQSMFENHPLISSVVLYYFYIEIAHYNDQIFLLFFVNYLNQKPIEIILIVVRCLIGWSKPLDDMRGYLLVTSPERGNDNPRIYWPHGLACL